MFLWLLVCFSAVSFFTALFEPFILRKKMNWTELALGILVIAGIYMIFHFDPKYKTGIMLGVPVPYCWHLRSFFIRGFIQRINPETVLTYQLSGGLVALDCSLCHFI